MRSVFDGLGGGNEMRGFMCRIVLRLMFICVLLSFGQARAFVQGTYSDLDRTYVVTVSSAGLVSNVYINRGLRVSWTQTLSDSWSSTEMFTGNIPSGSLTTNIASDFSGNGPWSVTTPRSESKSYSFHAASSNSKCNSD